MLMPYIKVGVLMVLVKLSVVVMGVDSGKQLATHIQKDIAQQKDAVKRIMNHVLKGPAKGEAYQKLAEYTDIYPHRMSGSIMLEDSIDYLLQKMSEDGFDNLTTETVLVPKWVRGEESASLIVPYDRPLSILGLGFSVATEGGGGIGPITAEVLVVNSFDELLRNASQAAGKIVVYNQPWKGYHDTYQYRLFGATKASEVGAVATLIRSLTPYSIYTPHTGAVVYSDNVTKIPAASITVEDAEFLQRLQDRGQKIEIKLEMQAINYAPVESRNIVAEIKGYKYPDQIVMFGAHSDSWDVGSGVMDDGAGVVISWQALKIIKELGLKPKRTLRMVIWTAEEMGMWGGNQYFEAHKNETDNISIAMETDLGTWTPEGLEFTGNHTAREIMKHVMRPLSAIKASDVQPNGGGADIDGWRAAGVPVASLANKNDKYFHFHHTQGDTLTTQDPNDLDLCLVVWASSAFTLANIETMLPRGGNTDSYWVSVDSKPTSGSTCIQQTFSGIMINYIICLFVLTVALI